MSFWRRLIRYCNPFRDAGSWRRSCVIVETRKWHDWWYWNKMTNVSITKPSIFVKQYTVYEWNSRPKPYLTLSWPFSYSCRNRPMHSSVYWWSAACTNMKSLNNWIWLMNDCSVVLRRLLSRKIHLIWPGTLTKMMSCVDFFPYNDGPSQSSNFTLSILCLRCVWMVDWSLARKGRTFPRELCWKGLNCAHRPGGMRIM